MNFGISDKSYRCILEALESVPEIGEVLIFGSRAMGNFKPGSDIGLALKGENVTSQTAIDLASRLNEVLPIPYLCDVVSYNTLESPELKKHIDQQGVNFFRR